MLILILVVFALSYWLLRRRQRTRSGVQIVLLGLFLTIGSGIVPHYLLTTLQSPYANVQGASWGKDNVIIVLGAGTARLPGAAGLEPAFFSYGRIAASAAQYRACEASGAATCRVLVSGGDPQQHGQSEARVYADTLMKLGVPARDLVVEDKSKNTWQNARNMATILAAWPGARTVLVTSGLHMRRSLLYFAHFGIKPIPVRADWLSVPSTVWPNAYDFALTDIAIHEYTGIARFYFYNLMGWNGAASAPQPSN